MASQFRKWTFTAIAAAAVLIYGNASSTGVPPGLRALDESGHMPVSASDRCPVCGMRVIRYPHFSTAIQLHDKTTYYFCSAGCMIRAWLQPEIFLGQPKSRILRTVAKNYFTGRPVDALKAIWIAGSDVIGPMGPAVISVSGPEEQRTFQRRHGGTRVFRLPELTDELWQAILGNDSHGSRP